MKTRKLALIFVFALILPLALAACGGDPGPGDIEDAIESAVNDGDSSDWNDIACEDSQLSDEDLEFFEGTEVSVSCEEDGDNISCDLELSAEGQTQTVTTVYSVEDGEVCEVIEDTEE